jgi:hypothetical protein
MQIFTTKFSAAHQPKSILFATIELKIPAIYSLHKPHLVYVLIRAEYRSVFYLRTASTLPIIDTSLQKLRRLPTTSSLLDEQNDIAQS